MFQERDAILVDLCAALIHRPQTVNGPGILSSGQKRSQLIFLDGRSDTIGKLAVVTTPVRHLSRALLRPRLIPFYVPGETFP